MVETCTSLVCDGCGASCEPSRDQNSSPENRAMNALALARQRFWVRVRGGGRLWDYCNACVSDCLERHGPGPGPGEAVAR